MLDPFWVVFIGLLAVALFVGGGAEVDRRRYRREAAEAEEAARRAAE